MDSPSAWMWVRQQRWQGPVYQSDDADDAIGKRLLHCWMVQGSRDIHMALSPNGTSWPVAGQFTLNEQSDMTPRMLAFVPVQGDIAYTYRAWTGANARTR